MHYRTIEHKQSFLRDSRPKIEELCKTVCTIQASEYPRMAFYNLYALTGGYVQRCVQRCLGVEKGKTCPSVYLPACVPTFPAFLDFLCLPAYLPASFSILFFVSVCNLGVCLALPTYMPVFAFSLFCLRYFRFHLLVSGPS